ncbi:HD domain-containing protein [Enterococcus sp.]|uniref:HD domain-containing protein n=1 Tax=Enterococcus sp. TaxID=35783 RepID=UPI002FC730B5
MPNKIDAVIDFARQELADEKTGHDFKHVRRVANYAKMIVEADQLVVDDFVVQASAFLHDVIDDKIVADVSSKVDEVEALLYSLDASENQVKEILHSIQNMSYSKELTNEAEPLSLAGQIVQDADRLEAVGAMGILRTAYYGGGHAHPIHDETLQPKTFASKAEYRQGTTVINHFYEKLLLLPDKMNTSYARTLAFERKQFMEAFLKQFYSEWNV